jgi:hypothetical protein
MPLTDIVLITGAISCFAAAFFIAAKPVKNAAAKESLRKNFRASEENTISRKDNALSALEDKVH